MLRATSSMSRACGSFRAGIGLQDLVHGRVEQLAEAQVGLLEDVDGDLAPDEAVPQRVADAGGAPVRERAVGRARSRSPTPTSFGASNVAVVHAMTNIAGGVPVIDTWGTSLLRRMG